MELAPGKVAVVTGSASGIGFALAERFARAGMNVVLADVQKDALDEARARIASHDVDAIAVPTDVSDEEAVNDLAAATLERFGAVHVVCNNAGVASTAEPFFGPLSAWKWVLGVNLWGVIYGVRAFAPLLVAQGEGHIVNTASMAGLVPGAGAAYDASKHGVVALSEDLYLTAKRMSLPIGVSVLCPGWVRTNIGAADRNWPTTLGEKPVPDVVATVVSRYIDRAVAEGMTPAAVADVVADAIVGERFWVLPHPEFVELAVRRWHTIADGENPELDVELPGVSRSQMLDDIMAALADNPS
jgi:NAD(P)-dependent dehydrogenase (short-subunit alcohol dehydrogenase family)